MLKNKQGFTLVEALIAMLLVAIMAAGIITALMATKRSIIAPSNREEMIMAIETASIFVEQHNQDICTIPVEDILTPTSTETCDLANNDISGCHNIDCLRPASCQRNGDKFVYSVEELTTGEGSEPNQVVVNFRINCEGQTI